MTSTSSSNTDGRDARAAPAAHRGEDSRQYVTFRLDDALWGVPLADVQEIMRMPNLVRMPRSPESLAGLANLRGAVLPVADLRRLLRFADAAPDDASRVVVLDRGFPVGLIVDGMASLANVEASRIEPADATAGRVDATLLQGMFRHQDGSSAVGILDADALLRRDFTRKERSITGLATRYARAEAAAAEPGQAGRHEVTLVSFDVARQEYALPLDRVREITPLPTSISIVPRADTAVLGVTSLRDELIPLLSLHALLGFPVPERTEERPRVLVVSYGKKSVGLVADRTREVLRIDQRLINAVPTMLTRGGGSAELQAICRLDGGRRLVSVLSPDRLFGREGLPKAIVEGTDADTTDSERTDMTVAQSHAADEQQFIVFRLDREEYAIPIEAVDEVARRPAEHTRVPKAAAFIEGVMNLRGAVIPVVDQRRRFDLPAVEASSRQRVIVITFDGLRAGFLVDGVTELLKIPGSAIGPAPELAEEQVRLISRVANLTRQNRMILIVDAPQLLDRRELGLLRRIQRAGAEPAP
jgi:purine-binding chemotaxis protein CheW